MLLESKNALVYGGGGAMGGAVARAFAREGANVFLAGRTLAKLDAVAEEITAAGGVVETAQVDALDEQAVENHAAEVASRAGTIDVSINAISLTDVQGVPLVGMSPEDFTRPVTEAARTNFLTATTAARRMTSQGSGVTQRFSSATSSPWWTAQRWVVCPDWPRWLTRPHSWPQTRPVRSRARW